MEFFLYHKNIPVLSFDVDEDFFITGINEIFSESHVPVGILDSYSEKPLAALRSWWSNRAIPANRKYLKETLEVLHVRTSRELLSKCHGLSLSDHYWIGNSGTEVLECKNINFFDNDFSEEIGRILTGNFAPVDIGSISFVSPDASVDGWLPKKWIIENGERYLVKGGSETFQQEPFNEVLSSRICEKLGIPHVEYTLASHARKNRLEFYSVCRNMASPNSELIPAYALFKTAKPDNNTDSLTRLFKACESAGMKNIDSIKQSFAKMSVLDFLIANTDRHLNNFGFLRNPDTLEWQEMAPVFDTGTSFFCKNSAFELRNPDATDSDYVETKPFGKTLSDQFAKIRKVCGTEKFDFSSLDEITESIPLFLAQNPQNEGRCEQLGRIFSRRIIETERIVATK
ncbi:MAG: HipA domain-containing protein [Treponemataceae bacterium]|nr:HipA domain-containing protein [Treponemataceae bacterium]